MLQEDLTTSSTASSKSAASAADDEEMNIQTLVDKIAQMTDQEHKYIFTLVSRDTKRYTKNRNGVFVNMSVLSKETLRKIHEYVKFSEQRLERKNGEIGADENNF